MKNYASYYFNNIFRFWMKIGFFMQCNLHGNQANLHGKSISGRLAVFQEVLKGN
jgi:hypothetical protein